MRLINKSRWDSNDLLKLLRECFKRAGEDIKEYTIIIANRRARGVGGRGSYIRKWIKLFLPTRGDYVQGADGQSDRQDLTELSGEWVIQIAQVTIHETDHTRGLHHKEMIGYSEIQVPWAKDFVIRQKQPKSKPTMDEIIRKRYEKIQANIKRKETRMKRLKTSLKKLHNRRKYYERKLR